MENAPRRRSTAATSAAIYCRISDDREGTERGVARQEEDCRARAEREGFEVVDVYVDNDLSASTKARKPRPEYARLMADARAGRFAVILAYSNSRLTRRPRELEDLIDHHAKHGTRFLTIVSGDDDLSTAAGRRNARIKASVDAGEAEETAERARRAKAQAAAQGRYRGGPRPFGYEADGMTVREDEADVVREMTTKLLSGRSLRSLVAELKARGVATPRGKEWTNRALKQVVVRPRNAAKISKGPADRHGMEILGDANWPAIVSFEEFTAVRDLLMAPSRRSSFKTELRHLGSGLYICGKCGTPMRPGLLPRRKGETEDDERRFQYRCERGLHLTVTAEPTDEYVRGRVVDRLRDPAVVASLGASRDQDRAALIEADRGERDVLVARLEGFERDYAEGVITGAQLQKATVRVQAEIEEVDARLSKTVQRAAASPLFAAPDPGKEFLRAPLDIQRAVLASLLRVEVLPSGPGVRWSHKRLSVTPVVEAA